MLMDVSIHSCRIAEAFLHADLSRSDNRWPILAQKCGCEIKSLLLHVRTVVSPFNATFPYQRILA